MPMYPESRKIQKSYDFMGQVVLFPPTCNGRPPGPSKVAPFWKGAVDISPVFLGIQKGCQMVPQMLLAKFCQKNLWLRANSCAWSLKTCLVSRQETSRNGTKSWLQWNSGVSLLELFSHVWFLHLRARNYTGSFAILSLAPSGVHTGGNSRWNSLRFPTDLGNILERDWSSSLLCWLSARNLSGEREGVTPMLQCDMASSLSQPRAQDHSLIVEISMRWIFFMVNDNTCKTIGMHSYKWCRNMSSQYVHIPKAL